MGDGTNNALGITPAHSIVQSHFVPSFFNYVCPLCFLFSFIYCTYFLLFRIQVSTSDRNSARFCFDRALVFSPEPFWVGLGYVMSH